MLVKLVSGLDFWFGGRDGSGFLLVEKFRCLGNLV